MVAQLHNAGVTSLRVSGRENYDAVCDGKFRFGMHKGHTCVVQISMLVHALILVLMSPECAISPPWRRIFGSTYYQQHLAVNAIDEAHCIADWYIGNTCTSHLLLMCICSGGVIFDGPSANLVGCWH